MSQKPEYLYNAEKCPCPRGGKVGCPRYRDCNACVAFHHQNQRTPMTACERLAVSEGYDLSEQKVKAENKCRAWYEGDPILEEYHDHEWCKINHDDRFEFEMLSLEGASVGLSWKTIMHKRDAYKAAFHNFDIDACAAMTDEELTALMENPGLIRNRSKIFSVRKNAQIVQKIQAEYGSFDAYLWSFTDGSQIDGHWTSTAEMPTESDVSRAMSKDMKKRGIAYVGPVITYSFLQAIGMVNDHLEGCPYR